MESKPLPFFCYTIYMVTKIISVVIFTSFIVPQLVLDPPSKSTALVKYDPGGTKAIFERLGFMKNTLPSV